MRFRLARVIFCVFFSSISTALFANEKEVLTDQHDQAFTNLAGFLEFKNLPLSDVLNPSYTAIFRIINHRFFAVSSFVDESATIVPKLIYQSIYTWYHSQGFYLLFLLSGSVIMALLIYAGISKSEKATQVLDNFNYSDFDSITLSLKKEELIQEINLKNQELANLSMHLIERGKLISKVREEIQAIVKNELQPNQSSNFRSILRMLADAEKQEDDWEQFAIHFDEVHRNFLSLLKSEFPVLSTTDLKLCAYLRLNLSSKEIAQSLNITVKGVEVSRYRLRKKLNLSKEINLTDFLLQLSKSGDGTPSTLSENPDELARFLLFFNKSMTAKFISQGGYQFR